MTFYEAIKVRSANKQRQGDKKVNIFYNQFLKIGNPGDKLKKLAKKVNGLMKSRGNYLQFSQSDLEGRHTAQVIHFFPPFLGQ